MKDGNKITLKSNMMLYTIMWIIFILVLSFCLSRVSRATLFVLVVYFIWYIGVLRYETKRMTKIMKEEYHDIWLRINVNPMSNSFKWNRVLKEYMSEYEGIGDIKKNLNMLSVLHSLHIASFFILPHTIRMMLIISN